MKLKKQFKPTEDMVSLANSVFLAMAYTETMREIVEEYQSEVLIGMQAWDRHDGKTIILSPKDAWRLTDKDFAYYDAACKRARDTRGLHVDNPDFCPLLVAEDLLRQAERALVDSMQPVTGLTADDVLCSHGGLDNYKKMIDLTLRLLVPFVKKAA